VWCIPLDQPAHIAQRAHAWLSPDEQARAARFHFERDQRRYIMAHAALRQILANCLVVEPADVQFVVNPRGKPALTGVDTDVCFNLAHSGELAVVAVTHGRAVGVDVEQIHPLEDLLALAEHNFSRREIVALRALPAEQQLLAFFDCWTRKEAFIKALGEGLYYPLDAFDVTLAPGEPARLESIHGQPASGWSLHAFTPAPGHAGALAVQGSITELRCEYWASFFPIPYPLSSEDCA
jgi:4'-phosphopantetheinyl transferase